jgi:mannose-6-phosphate isomerase-like protein (cupin superfamily)
MDEEASVSRTAPVQFEYGGTPPPFNAPKKHFRLCRTPLLDADIQVLGKKGANNLHSHSGNDGFWFVLEGRARFYDPDDNVIADLGPLQGVCIEHDTPYWFESAGEDLLEILHVGASDPRVKDQRVDHRPRRIKGGLPVGADD